MERIIILCLPAAVSQGVSGGACGGACAFFHLNTKDSVDPLFIYMVWPPRETPFVCAGACSFFHLNEKYSVDYLFFYMVWEPRATPPFARAHLLNVGHGQAVRVVVSVHSFI